MDVFNVEKRSAVMAGIKSKNTKPEILIRKILYKNGLRFSLHKHELPGNPDIFLKKHKTLIFVNGCFWHKHDCHMFTVPKSRKTFWMKKLERNFDNDIKNIKQALKEGWRIIIIWECAIKGKNKLSEDKIELKLMKFIMGNGKKITIRGKSLKNGS